MSEELKREKDDVIFNRRRDTRIETELNVSFEVSLDGPHSFYSGFTQDISKGGVFLATHQLYPLGTEMNISFILEGREISAKTKVMWVRKPETISGGLEPGMGLRFVEMKEEDLQAVISFIDKKETIFFDDEE